jgi:hypothetical protein
VLVLVPALGSRLPRDRGEGQGEGAVGAAFPAGTQASRLVVTERERRGPGEGAVGVAFFAGVRDKGGTGVRTLVSPLVWATSSSSPLQQIQSNPAFFHSKSPGLIRPTP